jgi:transglutaminase-like putative cysteine protease
MIGIFGTLSKMDKTGLLIFSMRLLGIEARHILMVWNAGFVRQ